MGQNLDVPDDTRQDLIAHASAAGNLPFDSAERIVELLQVIVATPEYQLA